MSDTVTTLPKQGYTLFGGQNLSATYGTSVNLEGTPHEFNDTSVGAGPDGRRSGVRRKARLVRNASAYTLEAKRLVKWQSGYRNRRVDGYCNATDEACAGIVDEQIGSAGVSPYDMFWCFYQGPCLVRTSLAGNAENSIALDDLLLALTAVTSGATTSGRVYPWTGLTVAIGGTTDGTIPKRLRNTIGRALSAKTTANTNADVLVDLMLM